MTHPFLNIPDHWKLIALKSLTVNKKNAIVDGPFGTQMKVHEFVQEGIPVIEMSNINEDFFKNVFRRYITEEKLKEIERSLTLPGDILISKTGSLGYIAIVPQSVSRAVITSRLAKVSIDWTKIHEQFLFYYLLLLRKKGYWEKIAKGSTMKVLNIGQIAGTIIPLPPLPEQHRIIEKIEELFSELDNGLASLKQAKEQLKVYRQSVLKWAFEGRLTNEELKDGELPDGYNWVKLGGIADKITDGEHITPMRTKEGVLLLSARNIQNGYLNLSDVDHIPEDEYQRIRKRCNPEYGDILISCSGSVGRICRVPDNLVFTMVRSVALVKLNSIKYSSKYFEYLLLSPLLQKQIEKGKKATAQANLFLGPIKNLDVIVCSIESQMKIVQEIESRFSIADQMEQSIDESLLQVEALRQSILKSAFEGRLI